MECVFARMECGRMNRLMLKTMAAAGGDIPVTVNGCDLGESEPRLTTARTNLESRNTETGMEKL